MRYVTHPTPAGTLTLVAGETGLRSILWEDEAPPAEARRGETNVLVDARRQLDAYFAGRLRAFALPLELRGTEFQLRAWRGLATVPYGETRSYGEQARLLSVPRAIRAIGAANGRNPLPIVLPCHRLIGADGSLVRYGGGLELKRALLAFERAQLAADGRRPDWSAARATVTGGSSSGSAA